MKTKTVNDIENMLKHTKVLMRSIRCEIEHTEAHYRDDSSIVVLEDELEVLTIKYIDQSSDLIAIKQILN